MFTYAHVKWFYGQSERAYYLNYFITGHTKIPRQANCCVFIQWRHSLFNCSLYSVYILGLVGIHCEHLLIRISVEKLSATIFAQKIPILLPLLNFIHTGMDENQQQSKANKSADEVVSSIVNIFLHYYALVIKRYMLCLIFVLGVNIIFLWFC